MSETVDARGMLCPRPLIETRKVLSKTSSTQISVLVDNTTAAENVSKMARDLGWSARMSEVSEGEFHISLEQGQSDSPDTGGAALPEPDSAPVIAESESCGTPSQVVVLVASNTMGAGDDELGAILMQAFIKTLVEVIPQPTALIFLNGGVKLTTEGSSVVDDLRILAERGAQVLSCGTCLDYYHLKDKLHIGVVSNMWDIATLLISADRVVRP